MTKRIYRSSFAALGFVLTSVFISTAHAMMGGVDHLADNLSVTDFWVNGAAGFQAGAGNASVPSPALPDKWHAGLMAHVVWHVRDWERDTSATHEADVPIEPYTEDGGDVWVHFLADGTVRVVVSNIGPRSTRHPGPHDPIPQKNPWDMYPPRIDWRVMKEQLLDDQIVAQRCVSDPDPKRCEKQADENLLDEQRADARRYMPPCASKVGESYLECTRKAEESMRVARLVRRCQVAPGLPECTARNAWTNAFSAASTAGALER